MVNKLLVIAGTHQRENRLSYGVVDLIDKLRHQENKTHICGADSSAVVTDYGNLVTAKIFTSDSSVILSQYEPRWHWTSVHGKILEQVDPLFFIDIHGWHRYGRGAENTGVYIKPHSKERYVAEIKQRLIQAQRDNPSVYGEGKNIFPRQQDKTRLEMKRKLMKQQGLSGLIKRLFSFEERQRLMQESNEESLKKTAREWGNNWFILENDEQNATENFTGYSCFTLEGIDEENCQEPIAKFIVDYVLKDWEHFVHA